MEGDDNYRQRTEVERIADAIIPRPNRAKLVAQAAIIYGDESGSSNVFVLSTYMASVENWARFEGAWKSILREAGLEDDSTGRLRPFHMADFESRFDPFGDWDATKRVMVLRQLIDAIREANALGVSVALPLALYQKGMHVNAHLPLDHPLHRIMQYMMCFYGLHLFLLASANLLNLSEPIPMVMDRNEVSAGMVQGVLDLTAKEFPQIRELIDPVVFQDKSIMVPLQAADILAYETMKHRDNAISQSGRPIRRSFDYLLGDRKRHISRDCDEKFIAEIASLWPEVSGLLED